MTLGPRVDGMLSEPVPSGGWTGDQTKAAALPPTVPACRDRRVMALLVMAAMLMLWVAWWALLSLHSPLAPHPPTSQTTRLPLRQNSVAPLYVRPWEANVSHGLAIAAFVVPGAYLAWTAIRRRSGR